MKQKQVKSIPAMLVLATQIIGALQQFAASIGLLHVTQAIVEAVSAELETARDNYESAKVELAAHRLTLVSLVQSAHEFATGARDVLKRTLGKRHSAAWHQTGFRFSLEVPRSADELHALLQSLMTFFANHPALEVPQLNLTAAYAESLLQDLTTAQTAINVQLGAVDKLITVRNEKAFAMKKLMRSLIDELGMKLDPMDSRWLAFGFNKPGAKATPDAPENVAVKLVSATAAAVGWPHALRAEYYRLYKKVVGVDAEMIAVGSPADRDFTLEDLPPNSEVQVAVSSVNDGGESPLSEVVTFMTG